MVTAPPAPAAGTRDVTADVLADRDVTLTGDTLVTVPAGTTTYDGVFRGEGTLTVRGGGTLLLTKDSDVTLPGSRQRQTVRTPGGDHPYGAITFTGTTTVEKGTLALRGGATLAHSRGIRLISTRARLDAGTAGLRVVSALSGRGTVKGTVTNDGVVAGGLTVSGGYTQSVKGELVLEDSPLKVAGRVRLSGALDLAAAGIDPARRITVLDNKGGSTTTGAFTDLPEGTRLKLADTDYRITYRGGDGNDVTLTAATASASPDVRSGTDTTAPRTTGAVAEGLGWWPYVLALGLLGGLVVPPTVGTRGKRRNTGRHAAP